MSQSEKQIIWRCISILYQSLQKPGAWYTGLSIKKYIQRNVFNLSGNTVDNPGIVNSSIKSGRWSAYCHFSRLLAFRNLLDKHQLVSGSHVLIHPLLPSPLIDELIRRNYSIEVIDIHKTDLGFNQDLLNSYFEEHEQHDNFPVLIIDYGFTGIYKSILETLKKAYLLAIPTLLVIDNPHINVHLLEIFEEHKLGSVLWFFGDGFFDDQLNLVLDTKLETSSWYLSWYLETRTRSLLEYHLSDSHEMFLPLYKDFFYLLLKRYQKLDFKSFILPFLSQKILLKLKDTHTAEVSRDMLNLYEQSLDFALPDVVFDLHNEILYTLKSNKYPVSHHELSDFSAQIHIKARNLYDFLSREVTLRPRGTLEIPFFYTDKTYLEYYFYTSDKANWYNELGVKGYSASSLPELHSIIRQNQLLVQAQFVTDYLLSIDLVS